MKTERSTFANNPEAQAIQRMIHDSNRSMSHVRMTVNNVRDMLIKKGVAIDDDLKDKLDYLYEQKAIKKSIDEYIVKWKNHFETENTTP